MQIFPGAETASYTDTTVRHPAAPYVLKQPSLTAMKVLATADKSKSAKYGPLAEQEEATFTALPVCSYGLLFQGTRNFFTIMAKEFHEAGAARSSMRTIKEHKNEITNQFNVALMKGNAWIRLDGMHRSIANKYNTHKHKKTRRLHNSNHHLHLPQIRHRN